MMNYYNNLLLSYMKYNLGKEFFVVLKISSIYIVLSLIVALIIDNIFNMHIISSPMNIDNKNSIDLLIQKTKIKNNNARYKLKLFFTIFLQVIVCVISIFYLRKFVHTFSFVKKHKKFISPTIYSGEIAIAFIFIGTQYNLLNKLVQFAS